MKMLRKLREISARLLGLFGYRRAESEFSDEVQEHLRLLTERFMIRGMSREEASRAARLQFGNATLVQQKQRERRAFLSPTELWRDACFGVRMLRKHPGSTAGVIVALALGIGMNACVFTFVNALLLRPPAGVRSPGELCELWEHSHTASGMRSYMPLTYPDYAYFRDHSRSFAGIIGYDGDPDAILWNRAGQGEVVHGQFVSGNFFSVTGVGTVLGRAFSSADDQPGNPQPLVVLGNTFWRERLAADPGIVGKSMMLNGINCTVIGVAQAGFTGLVVGMSPDFWATLSMSEQIIHDPGRLTNRFSNWLLIQGRLAPGQTTKTAQAEMNVLAREIEKAHPDSNKDQGDEVFTAAPVPGPFRGYVRAFTGLLMAVFALVLVIACSNAASLVLVKASGRSREMAIRSALGAGRGRLIRQMTVESVLLSLIAGCAAVALSWWTSHLLLNLIPANLPISLEIPFDWRVLAFTFLVALITGVVFGVTPALRGTRVDPVRVLKEENQSGGYKRSRMRSVLMAGEVAICALLLFCATLCVRSLLNASSIDPGFNTQNVAVATLDPGSLGYSDEKVQIFYRNFDLRVRSLPGVVSLSYVNHLPLDASREGTGVMKASGENFDRDAMPVDVYRIAPDYFRTMCIPILQGRDFSQSDVDRKTNVVMINDTLAHKLWPGESPVGQWVKLRGDKVLWQVVGIVKTGKYRTLGEMPLPVVYRKEIPGQRVLVVRTLGDPRTMLDPLARATQEVDRNMAATGAQTMAAFMAFPLFPARVTGLLLGASGILALVLTWIGLFGVISFAVSQRTREIGVRMAMGARRSDVLKLVMRQGLFVTAIGLAIGMGGALAAARLLSELLYGIRPDDPVTVVGVVLGLTAVTMLACYIPARRAMQVEPTTALRYE